MYNGSEYDSIFLQDESFDTILGCENSESQYFQEYGFSKKPNTTGNNRLYYLHK